MAGLQLFGEPPYHFKGTRACLIMFEAAVDEVRPLLPPQLTPLDNPMVMLSIMDCPDVTGLGPHIGGCLSISARCGDRIGSYVPWLITDTEQSLIGFRESVGWPTLMGETILEEDQGHVRARMSRGDQLLVDVRGEVKGEVITTIADSEALFAKPRVGGPGPLAQGEAIIAARSDFSNVALRMGAAEVTFGNIPEINIIIPNPVGEIAMLYGTWDDIHPSSVEVVL